MPNFNPKIIENVDLTLVGQKGKEAEAGFLSEKLAIMMHLENKIKNVLNPALCQVIWAKEEDNTFDILAGYPVSRVENLPEELIVYPVKSEKIAAFVHQGDTPSLSDFIRSIYADWRPNSGYRLNNLDFTQIQFVSQSPETDNLLPSEQRIFDWEVWIPIK